jgi:N-acetylmuramoyl-L-alanine amidase
VSPFGGAVVIELTEIDRVSCGYAFNISVMLFAVRKFSLFVAFLAVGITSALLARPQSPQAQTTAGQPAPQQTEPPTPAPPPANPQQPIPPQGAPSQPAYVGPLIVLDPAHGGTDTGARGQNGAIEKDIVLQFARVARAALVRQGYRVVLTRDDDSNPSYDDRAAITNSYRDAIFISLHISSTGMIGTTRTYYYQFWKPLPPPALPLASDADQLTASAPTALSSLSTNLTPWEEAQRSSGDVSRRLADQLQAQLATVFPGSPGISTAAAVRGLRSVNAPAVAIEISSVSVTDLNSLTAMAAPFAASIGKGLQAFRSMNSADAK